MICSVLSRCPAPNSHSAGTAANPEVNMPSVGIYQRQSRHNCVASVVGKQKKLGKPFTLVFAYGLTMVDLGTDKRLNWNAVVA